MTAAVRLFSSLLRDKGGAMAVETAIVAPVLILMSLGAFQVSQLVARQNELQSAMSVAESIALASDPDSPDKLVTVKNILVSSAHLKANQVTVTAAYRCNSDTAYVATSTTCATGANISSYVKIQLSETYTPVWVSYGIGNDISLNLVRYVMYRQGTNP